MPKLGKQISRKFNLPFMSLLIQETQDTNIDSRCSRESYPNPTLNYHFKWRPSIFS